MTTIGFIGLGIMGAPMAGHLVTAGHRVVGFDVHRPAVETLSRAGGIAADSVVDVADAAEVVITMLPDHPQVEDVMFGDEGALAAARPGTLLIDMSTIRPATAIAVARAGAEQDLRVLDAPVSGGQVGAQQATLSIMVGGSEADVAAARPILDVLGKTVVHVGGPGAGQVVKAANQLVVAGIYGLISEAIVLLDASGVEAKAGLDVLAGGLAANRILDLKRESMIAREFTPGFRIDLHHKDMGIVLDAARQAGVSLPISGLSAQLIAAARAQGHGGLDHSALLTVVEQLSGRGPQSPS